MRIAITCGQLDNAKSIAVRVKPHGLAIDGNFGTKIKTVRQVGDMQMICHVPAITRLVPW
jgi:hypothetical protein